MVGRHPRRRLAASAAARGEAVPPDLSPAATRLNASTVLVEKPACAESVSRLSWQPLGGVGCGRCRRARVRHAQRPDLATRAATTYRAPRPVASSRCSVNTARIRRPRVNSTQARRRDLPVQGCRAVNHPRQTARRGVLHQGPQPGTRATHRGRPTTSTPTPAPSVANHRQTHRGLPRPGTPTSSSNVNTWLRCQTPTNRGTLPTEER